MIDQEIQAKLREKFNPEGSMLRKQQLRMLEILLYIDKVCKENNITPIIMTMPPLVGDRWFENVSKNLNKENIAKFLGENPGDKLSRNNELYNLNIIDYAIKNDVKIADVRKLFLQLLIIVNIL